MAGTPRDLRAHHVHEGQRVGARRVAREHRARRRALQRQKRAVGLGRQFGHALQALGDIGEVGFLHRRH